MKKRSEIDEIFKWDLSKFCKDDQDFYAKLENLTKRLSEFKKFEGKLGDENTLLKYLKFEMQFSKDCDFTSYAFLRQSEDGADRSANEMMEKRGIFFSKLQTISTTLEAEIDKFSLKKLQQLHKSEKFKDFKRYFEDKIRHKKHTLSKKEEILLSKLCEFTGGFSDNFDKFSDADLKFDNVKDSEGKEHELDQSKYSVYAESDDRVLRENTFREINGKRGEFINFLASNYINDVKQDCVFAKLRHFKSALSQAIYSEEASEAVYDMLIKKVRENIGILQRYFEIKRKMLNLPQFAIYDTFAPVVKGMGKKFTYDEAVELVKEAVAPLGKEYVELVQRAKDERWIDVLPNKGKYSGAYSSSTDSYTPCVLLNFANNLEGVFTLAHELGHAMHSYYSTHNQPVQTAHYEIFVAEVASITNEMLLLRLLLKNAKTKDEKIRLFDYFLKEVKSTIFRQTMFAEFEEFAHAEYEKEHPLSAELLCEKYEELNNFYHGKNVKQIPQMRFEWARIPHFYDSFYVYKYATGMISAIKISDKICRDEGYAKKYLKFLSSGSSKDPISLLIDAECDLTKEQTFDDAFETCEQIISDWENLLNN